MKNFQRVAASLLLFAAHPAQARSLLVISVDGLRADYVTEAEKHGIKVPNLRRLMVEGSYAQGVRPTVPSITFPSHITLVTGVDPNRHGIVGNDRFDPTASGGAPQYWFARDITADTLWQAAARAGLSTGSLGWPITAGQVAIRYNIPHLEPYESTETVKLQEAMARPDGLLEDLESKLGSFYQDSSENGSRIRARFSLEILKRYKPQFMTVHFVSLDHGGHVKGPFSPAANAALEAEDALVGELRAQALANDPDAIIAVVSDHGMAPVTQNLNLRVPLIEAGLITRDAAMPGKAQRITDWKAEVWGGGGSAAVYLKDPADQASKAKVAEILHRLAADRANGIAQIVEGADVAALGGYPGASFVIGMKPGFAVGTAYSGPLLVAHEQTGTHGYLPDVAECYASFLIAGKGIAAGRNLGVVDMRQIAPTLAKALGVTLKDADQPQLPVFARN